MILKNALKVRQTVFLRPLFTDLLMPKKQKKQVNVFFCSLTKHIPFVGIAYTKCIHSVRNRCNQRLVLPLKLMNLAFILQIRV